MRTHRSSTALVASLVQAIAVAAEPATGTVPTQEVLEMFAQRERTRSEQLWLRSYLQPPQSPSAAPGVAGPVAAPAARRAGVRLARHTMPCDAATAALSALPRSRRLVSRMPAAAAPCRRSACRPTLLRLAVAR